MGNVRVLATDLEFPEGPVVMPDGSVVLVEIRGRRLTRVWPDGRKEVVAQIPGGPNGAALGPDGKMYVCNNGGFSWIPGRGMILMPGPQSPAEYIGGSIQRVDMSTRQGRDRGRQMRRAPAEGAERPGVRQARRAVVHRSWQAPRPRHGCRRGLLHQARHEGDRRGRIRHVAGQRHRSVAGREHGLFGRNPDGAAVGYESRRPGEIKPRDPIYRGERGKPIAGLGGYQMFELACGRSDQAMSAWRR